MQNQEENFDQDLQTQVLSLIDEVIAFNQIEINPQQANAMLQENLECMPDLVGQIAGYNYVATLLGIAAQRILQEIMIEQGVSREQIQQQQDVALDTILANAPEFTRGFTRQLLSNPLPETLQSLRERMQKALEKEDISVVAGLALTLSIKEVVWLEQAIKEGHPQEISLKLNRRIDAISVGLFDSLYTLSNEEIDLRRVSVFNQRITACIEQLQTRLDDPIMRSLYSKLMLSMIIMAKVSIEATTCLGAGLFLQNNDFYLHAMFSHQPTEQELRDCVANAPAMINAALNGVILQCAGTALLVSQEQFCEDFFAVIHNPGLQKTVLTHLLETISAQGPQALEPIFNEAFRPYCEAHPSTPGCRLLEELMPQYQLTPDILAFRDTPEAEEYNHDLIVRNFSRMMQSAAGESDEEVAHAGTTINAELSDDDLESQESPRRNTKM